MRLASVGGVASQRAINKESISKEFSLDQWYAVVSVRGRRFQPQINRFRLFYCVECVKWPVQRPTAFHRGPKETADLLNHLHHRSEKKKKKVLGLIYCDTKFPLYAIYVLTRSALTRSKHWIQFVKPCKMIYVYLAH